MSAAFATGQGVRASWPVGLRGGGSSTSCRRPSLAPPSCPRRRAGAGARVAAPPLVAAAGRRPLAQTAAAPPPPPPTADCYIGFDGTGGGFRALSAPCSGPSCVGVGLFAAAAAAFGAAYWFKTLAVRQKEQQGQRRRRAGNGGWGGSGGAPEPWPEIPSAEDDPEGYRLALARTRQAQHVARASALARAGDPARAMVELGRALHENETCRSPLLDGHHTREQLSELYVLFVQNSPTVPPPFAHLLQLRVMLGLGEEVAEELEAQALREAAAFSI